MEKTNAREHIHFHPERALGKFARYALLSCAVPTRHSQCERPDLSLPAPFVP